MSVNLGGMINCLLAFLPRMAEQEGEKHIVLTASIAGLAPFNMTIYSTTKYAIVGMGESLAQESEANGYGIGVSILCPGGVDTKFGTSNRNRPDGPTGQQVSPTGSRARLRPRPAPDTTMDPRDVGVCVRDAIVDGDLYIVPHPYTRALVEARVRAPQRRVRQGRRRLSDLTGSLRSRLGGAAGAPGSSRRACSCRRRTPGPRRTSRSR